MALELTLPEAIKSIRKAWHMTTAEFAREIGVAQSVVSRYESGKRSPGRRVVLKLMLLARGAEKEPIREALSRMHGQPLAERECISVARQVAKEEQFVRRAVEYINLSSNDQFATLASEIISSRKQIDDSLNTILSVWLLCEPSPDVVRHFQDAARFLQIALLPGAGETTEILARELGRRGLFVQGDELAAGVPSEHQRTARASYRVILPVDLGDGVVHAFGDIVDLDLATALKYSHALLSAKPEALVKKKLA